MLQKIETPISDLFFMVDNSGYWKSLENNEEEAEDSLREQAVLFSELMHFVGHEVDVDDLIADWHERV